MEVKLASTAGYPAVQEKRREKRRTNALNDTESSIATRIRRGEFASSEGTAAVEKRI
jgi:hypothetical protein